MESVIALPTPKQFRHRLRSRIIISFLLLGGVLTTLFAAATLVLRASLENQLVEEALQREVDTLTRQVREAPEQPPAFSLIEAWSWSPRTLYRAPLAWQGLETGVHDVTELDAEGRTRHYKLAVRRDDDIISFVRYDASSASVSSRRLVVALGIAVVGFSILAGLLGRWSAARVMRPVGVLAARLRAYGGDPQREPLSPHFSDDEVGQLAAALDDYADQLTERVTRDREFNADVSHELRTPLAVIQGATELLLGQPDLAPKARQRLQRIERAAQQCTDLTTALLMLSRNERASGATDVRKLVEQLAESNRVNIGSKPIDVRVEGQHGVLVDAPEAVLAVALGNLVVNAFKYTREGEIVIGVLGDRVEIVDTGPGIGAEEAKRLFERGYRGGSSEGSKGAGIGLAIVRRLCELYGWRASIRPRSDATGAVATLEFTPYRRS